MSEMEDIMEIKSHGLEIQSAILHVIDGSRHQICLSERTLDLEDPMIEKYVSRYVTRCENDMRARKGEFLEGSEFEKLLEEYFAHEKNLAQFSAEALSEIISYFEDEEPRSFEILVVDFRNDDVPYIAVVFLEEQETMTYLSDVREGRVFNTISFNHSSLPSFTKPLSAFALINLLNHEISMVDEGKWKDDRRLISDTLLRSKEGISHKEVINTVKEIALEVAEEFDENPAVILSKVKNHISESVNEGMAFKPQTLVSEVFEDEPEMAEVFIRKAQQKELPQEVELPKRSVTASMKKQKIVTDTGIEISFPGSLAEDREKIAFLSHDDGTITIEIRGVRSFDTKN